MIAPSLTRRYYKIVELERSRGIYRTTDAAPAREHLRRLLDVGGSTDTVAHLARLTDTGLRDIASGRTSIIRTSSARRILAITWRDLYAGPTPTSRVPAVGAGRRVHALVALGWPYARIAEHAGLGSADVARSIPLRPTGNITRATHEAILRTYAALSMTPGPSERSRRHAARMGYAPPLAWDDDEIDDPTASEPGRGRWEVAA